MIVSSMTAPASVNGKPLIKMRGLVKNYKTSAGEFPALKGIDLEVTTGEFIGILGKSGAGKTTLINLLTAVDHCSAGEIWVNGVAIHKLTENQAAAWRGRNLGVVYQSFQLMPTLSILRNIMLPMDFSRQYRRLSSPQLALQLLREVELEEHAHKLPSAISGGQQQRVAIARALANDPPIIVADEPTGRLDFCHCRDDLPGFRAPGQSAGKNSHHGYPRCHFHRALQPDYLDC